MTDTFKTQAALLYFVVGDKHINEGLPEVFRGAAVTDLSKVLIVEDPTMIDAINASLEEARAHDDSADVVFVDYDNAQEYVAESLLGLTGSLACIREKSSKEFLDFTKGYVS